MTLPAFRYHPDPVGTSSIVPSSAVCRACERVRGYIYTGPVYGEVELEDALCPWCIADGSAAARFAADFVDPAGVGDHGRWDGVSPAVTDEVAKRTPGFTGWQQERWWTHCGDAAAYLGRAGRTELQARWPEAIAALRGEIGFEGSDWEEYFRSLDAERSPTAYVFRCLHCGQLGGYSDFD